MSNKFNGSAFRNIHSVPVANSVPIANGDMVWRDDAGKAQPANLFPWTTDLPTTQIAFVAKFLGVAISAHVAGDVNVTLVQVDTSPISLWQTSCVLGLYKVGDPMAPAQDGASLNLSRLVLMAVDSPGKGIARVHNHLPVADASVSVHYASAFDIMSSNVNAQLG